VTKYKELIQVMISKNKELFDEFTRLHAEYGLEPDKHQEEFNHIGAKVMNVVKEYENKLCGRSENNGYASFSGNLAERYQNEVRKIFPLIDHIGIIVKKVPSFTIKKINLS